MKKKATSAASPLDSLRKTTAYPGARVMFGLPFLIMGCLYLLIGGWIIISHIPRLMTGDSAPPQFLLTLFAGGLCFVAGLFSLGVTFLADAIFDLADCAVRRDSRDKLHEALDSVSQRQRNRALEDY